MPEPSTYLYRCTEQQLEEHLQRIADAGDTVEHCIYKGGRDYVLVCRKAGEVVRPVVFDDAAVNAIAKAVRRGLQANDRQAAKNVSGAAAVAHRRAS